MVNLDKVKNFYSCRDEGIGMKDKSGECRQKVENCVVQGRKVTGTINVLVKEKSLNMDAVNVNANEEMMVPPLLNGRETDVE